MGTARGGSTTCTGPHLCRLDSDVRVPMRDVYSPFATSSRASQALAAMPPAGRVEQRVRVRRLLLQQRPVVANRPEEGAQRVALRAALLRVVDLAVGVGGERVALAAHAREEAPLARVPEPRGGDQLREPAAEAREDGPAPDGVEAVLLVV